MKNLIVDLFCGGGGASEGIRWALGRDPDVAVNHDESAIAMHEANHPGTRHLHGDVWHYAPRDVVGNTPVDLLWCSPTCTFFSQAKGGPLDRKTATKIRALAWVAVRWAREVRPRVLMIENVEPFAKWGPLAADGKPCPRRRGATFRKWVRAIEAEGYRVEWRELRACDYGAPTSRKRLFIVARRDGQPIVWPTPTHGRGLLPYRTAASCIDWSIPVPSIFGRKRPLAEATLRRIARGIRKFVLETTDPFIIPVSHAGDDRVHSIGEPLRTITASSRSPFDLVVPSLVHVSNGERLGQAPRIYNVREPLGTVVAGGIKHGLVAAYLAKHFGGHESPGQGMQLPLGTVTCRDHHALVTAHADGDRREEVRAFLTKFYGTCTGQQMALPIATLSTNHHYGLLTVHGQHFEIRDIGMRLLEPRELYRAQGFGDEYRIDGFSKTAQVRMVGNSVPPHLAAALVSANVDREEVAAA